MCLLEDFKTENIYHILQFYEEYNYNSTIIDLVYLYKFVTTMHCDPDKALIHCSSEKILSL